jgi:meso-butanediol dehydrogenase/(S,S)-butanediol dehydrogenase/diacetyl reductase
VTPNRVLLVTGAGSGIGAAVADRAARDGWRVVICGRRAAALDTVAARTGATPMVVDVTDATAVAELVATTVEQLGRLDGVVANAGVMTAGSILEVTPAEWDLSLRTNLTSVYVLARAALPHLLATGGSIVAVSSIAALRAPSAATAYAVSKAGLVMLVQSIARDFGGQGVRANVVCPGWVRTEMADSEMAEFGAPYGLDEGAAYAEVTRLVPQQRPAEAAEIAGAVTWLAGPDASYVNGACLVVDGGTILVDPGTVGLDYSLTARARAHTQDP